MISITAFRFALLTCLLSIGLALLVFIPNRLVSVEESVMVNTPSLLGFEKVKKGGFLAVKSQDKFHSLAIPITLTSNTYYRIRYDILQLPRDKTNLTSDFYAQGYDNQDQESNISIGARDLGNRKDFIFNSGSSPKCAHFRLFYSGGAGLEVENVKVTRVSTLLIWLNNISFFLTLGAIFVFLVIVFKRLKCLFTSEKKALLTPTRFHSAELAILLSLYLFAVLVRFIIYIALPYWSGDEYVYKMIASGIWTFGRHGVLTNDMVSYSVDLPNLLYPYLISPAFALGDNFYTAIRLVNSFLMNAAIFPSYLIARKYLNQTSSLVAAFLSITIPFVNLGAFVVTEVLFFPLFLASVWIALESIEHKNSILWAISFGLISAVLMNVRLTGMVMLPAYLVSLVWISVCRKQTLLLILRPVWLTAVITFACTYVAIKYSLDGKSIGDFGLYAGLAVKSSGSMLTIIKNPTDTFNLLSGHLTTLSIPYALPIAVLITTAFSWRDNLSDDGFNDFYVVALVFSVALFTLTLLFTINVSELDLGGLGRWHSRYYFYCYPLFIIAGAVIATHQKEYSNLQRIFVLIIVSILLVFNIYFIIFHGALKNQWFGSIVDNMDVQWYRISKVIYWLFILSTIFITWLWYKRSKKVKISILSFFAVWVFFSNLGTLHVARINDSVQADACGSLSQHFLDQHPGRFLVVGENRPALVGAVFWNTYIPKKVFIFPDATKMLTELEVGVDTDYLIVNGNITVSPTYRQLALLDKCAIYETKVDR